MAKRSVTIPVMKKITLQVIDHVKTGAALRDKRTAAGFTLREMQKRTGIAFSYLSALENGVKPWSEKLLRRYLSGLCQ